MVKSRRLIARDVEEILARAYDAANRGRKVTYGKYMVYAAPSLFEKETTTLANARRVVAKLRRQGFKQPLIKRHANSGNTSWNEVIEDRYRSGRR